MMRTAAFLVFMSAFCLCFTGCGPSGPKMAQVEGTVTVDGKKIPEGDITFVPLEKGGVPEVLKITNGSFSGEVQVGKRKVQISAYREVPPSPTFTGDDPPKENYIAEEFNTNSNLEANVTESGPNKFEFKVKEMKK